MKHARFLRLHVTGVHASVLLAAILLSACGGGGGAPGSASSPPAPATPTPPVTPRRQYGAEYFLSPSGSDSNPGTSAAPFQSLEKARDAVRARIAVGMPPGGIAVWLKGGVYERSNTLDLGPKDSGTSETNTVDWRAVPGETVRISGGRRLDAARFTKVTSTSPVWPRLDASAQGKVLQIDLKAEGITSFGTLKQRGFGGWIGSALELFINQTPMELARWPDPEVTQFPEQDINASSITLYGRCVPDVTGTYVKTGTSDGVSSFTRSGLVNGFQYQLYRNTWVYEGYTYTAWFISTRIGGQPYWVCYREKPGQFVPEGTVVGTGKPSAYHPARIYNGFAYTADPVSGTTFSYASDRPARWTTAPDAWVEGLWYWNWADYHLPVASLDTVNRTLTVPNLPKRNNTEDIILPDRPWYAYNLLEEITRPGEWYLDRTSGILYLWPPDSFSAGSEVVVSVFDKLLLSADYTAYLVLQDFTLEASRQNLLSVTNSDHVTVSNLILRNSGCTGGTIHGTNNLMTRCTLAGTGNSGIWLSGGDRLTLTHGNNRIENCEFHDYARTVCTNVFGVDVGGCGNVLRNNLFHHAPNAAFFFGGNDQLMELNEIHDVCQGSADAGAIYCGSDWGARGNLIRHNFIHHVKSRLGTNDIQGIYLDEMIEGIRCEGNILYAIDGYGIKARGGRDTIMRNNIIAKCGGVMYEDGMGLNWASGNPGPDRLQALIKLGYQQEPWKSRFPECAAIPNDWSVLTAPGSRWLAPEGCVFSRNVGWQNRSWIGRLDLVQTYFAEYKDNLENTDPLFTDEANLNLLLKPNSPAFLIPGFVDIPFDEIGLRP